MISAAPAPVTSTRARRIRRGVSGQEVSKPSVIVARRSAERIGLRIIARDFWCTARDQSTIELSRPPVING